MPIDVEDPDALVPEPRTEPEQPRENPFVTIWEAPRETIRWVVATDPRRRVKALFFASGFVGALSSLPTTLEERLEITVPVPLVFATALVIGLVTIVTGILNAWYKRWVGGLLGGDATREAVVAVSAYASIPSTVGYALVLAIEMALYGFEPFRPTHPAMDAEPMLLILTMWLGLGLASFWSVCVSVVGFAEVNRFSIARSIATSLLAVLIIAATIAAMGIAAMILVALLMRGSAAQ
jgi:hypothetical protein